MKGILFKPDMHQAIKEGRKTVTRRVVKFRKPINPKSSDSMGGIYSIADISKELELLDKGIIKPDISLSRYQVGEVVYIKEAFCYESDSFAVKLRIRYKSGGIKEAKPEDIPIGVEIYNYLSDNYPDCIKWRSPLFMPAWAARDFIQITDVRPERLQEITIADAELETGIKFNPIRDWSPEDCLSRFDSTWDSINPKYPYSSNPWVWRYEFNSYMNNCKDFVKNVKRIKPNGEKVL